MAVTCYLRRMVTTSPARGTRRFRRDVFEQRAKQLGYPTVGKQAAAVGLVRQQLSYILNGRCRPGVDTLDRMVDFLGIPADDFYPRTTAEHEQRAA